MTSIKCNLLSIRDDTRVDVPQISIPARLLRRKLTELWWHDPHDVRGGRNHKESEQRTVDDVRLHFVGRVSERKSDEHQIKAWLSERWIKMSDRRCENRNIFGEQMVGVFNAAVKIRNFIVSSIGKILLVSVINQSSSAMGKKIRKFLSIKLLCFKPHPTTADPLSSSRLLCTWM